MLHLRETAGADPIPAYSLLDPLEFTHRTEPAHTVHHRIEQAKEKQRQVAAIAHLAPLVRKCRGLLRLGENSLHHFLKDLEHIPVLQIFFCQRALSALHARTTAKWLNLYKLQLCYGQVTIRFEQ